MTDRAAVSEWIRRYLTAWKSNEPADVRALFTPHAEYRFHPWEEPRRGHEAITAAWLGSRDEPADFTFEWSTVAVDGDTAVVQARTAYVAGSAAGRTYDNLWVIRFAEDGSARSFTEWYVEQPDQAAAPQSD